MVNVRLKTTRVFARNWQSIKKILVNRGGTRSSKTYSLAQIAFTWLMTGRVDDNRVFESGIFSVVRKYSATLNATVIRDFEEIASQNGCAFLLSTPYKNKSEKSYKYNGRMLEFFGCDDQQKVRGRKRDILYCNEANELRYNDEFFQLMIRTSYKIFIDFNPDDEQIWINVELEQKRALDKGDVEIIVSTYKDNTYLDKDIVEEIEYLGKTNPSYWRIYGLGEYGKLEGLVFDNWKEILEMPSNYKFLGYGKDFGFTNDPTTLVGLYQIDDGIVFDEMMYKHGLTNQDIIKEYDDLGVEKTDEIFADSAEPKSIEEISRGGYNIHPCTKGKDSIIFGIDIIKQYPIFVTTRSVNIKKELKTYTRKQDKNGKYLNVPIDSNNHCFRGDTFISTNKGLIEIQNIREGDYVLTRYGYNKVLKQWNNGKKQIKKYLLKFDTLSIYMWCTLSHKICTDKGRIEISQLQSGDVVFLHKDLIEKNINYIREKNTSEYEKKECTRLYGNIIIEKNKNDFTSTIKTTINGIMQLKILKGLNDIIINQCTRKNFIKKIQNLLKNRLRKTKINVENGTRVRNEYNGIKNMQSQIISENRHIENDCVIYAERDIQKNRVTKNFVQVNVNQYIEEKSELMTLKKNVCIADDYTQKTNTPKKDFVHQYVLKSIETIDNGDDIVYDLMVENHHEYFANGVLVHNCIDAMRYVATEKLKKSDVLIAIHDDRKG